jgi:hypothetical protein
MHHNPNDFSNTTSPFIAVDTSLRSGDVFKAGRRDYGKVE